MKLNTQIRILKKAFDELNVVELNSIEISTAKREILNTIDSLENEYRRTHTIGAYKR